MQKNKFLILGVTSLLLISMSGIAAAFSFGQDSSGTTYQQITVKGKVKDKSGDGIMLATVKVTDEEGKDFSVNTGPSGGYLLRGPLGYNLTLTASWSDYTQTKHYNRDRGEHLVEVDFKLDCESIDDNNMDKETKDSKKLFNNFNSFFSFAKVFSYKNRETSSFFNRLNSFKTFSLETSHMAQVVNQISNHCIQ